jgi:hypothetical protein
LHSIPNFFGNKNVGKYFVEPLLVPYGSVAFNYVRYFEFARRKHGCSPVLYTCGNDTLYSIAFDPKEPTDARTRYDLMNAWVPKAAQCCGFITVNGAEHWMKMRTMFALQGDRFHIGTVDNTPASISMAKHVEDEELRCRRESQFGSYPDVFVLALACLQTSLIKTHATYCESCCEDWEYRFDRSTPVKLVEKKARTVAPCVVKVATSSHEVTNLLRNKGMIFLRPDVDIDLQMKTYVTDEGINATYICVCIKQFLRLLCEQIAVKTDGYKAWRLQYPQAPLTECPFLYFMPEEFMVVWCPSPADDIIL